MEVPHIADPELKHSLEIIVDDLVGRCCPVQVLHSHEVLFCLIPRENNDFFAPSASGSALIDAMVICPCSMGLLGRMAHGLSEDLITRSADVMLKERRKLIIVPRETPYNLIHLRNMTSLTEAGAIICPASPSFYSKPQTLEAAAQTVVDRVIDLIGLNHTSFRWGNSVNYP